MGWMNRKWDGPSDHTFYRVIMVILLTGLAIALALAAMGCTPAPLGPDTATNVVHPGGQYRTECTIDTYKEVCRLIP